MRSEWYQYTLIGAGIIATVMFGAFWKRELFPEYKIYQDDYEALEQFHSTYTHEPAPAFQEGIKQIVFERKDNGPPGIERCVSCHVALDIPYFSPTRLDIDVNGNIALDADGRPVQVPNEEYIWKKLDDKIAELTDPEEQARLGKEGQKAKIAANSALAEQYQALKTAQVDSSIYDVTKVLRMHPLIGRETRPFEYHPLTEYGCVSCHNGNGQGLTTEKAHGPVFDGFYETEFEGPEPKFTEEDPLNDPSFAFQFNHKPGPSLIFQTTPIFIGALVQAKCMICHQDSEEVKQSLSNATHYLQDSQWRKAKALEKGLDQDIEAALSLWALKNQIQTQGLDKTEDTLNKLSNDYTLPEKDRKRYATQILYLKAFAKSQQDIIKDIDAKLLKQIGSKDLTEEWEKQLLALQSKRSNQEKIDAVIQFLQKNKSNPGAKGALFDKKLALNLNQSLLQHAKEMAIASEGPVEDQNVISSMASDVDLLTRNYQRGKQLFLSQSCYACHKIAGFARGGVGPELTREGLNYPWFIKQSIVWPQADLPSSTMPNYRLDHEELQDLMTYLLAQVGEKNTVSSTAHKIQLQEWEGGKKMPWEKPITPAQMQDVRYGMTVFATEGCAACHRLKGFESDIGYRVELKGTPSFDELDREKEWFKGLIPEFIEGSSLVHVLEAQGKEIDEHIIPHVRQGSLLEEIEKQMPGQIESLYTPFKYAARAKNYEMTSKAEKESDPVKKAEILKQLGQWKDRVHRVLMMFVQEYGLGRLIGPRPNWSGVYRSDEWLMEHFHNPSSHVPRSIMPVFPFDDSKFYALTHMLDVLGMRNRDSIRKVWEMKGFNPASAFEIHCSQCHGEYKDGNGPVATWIYPIPKNLNNAEFLKNLTKERVIQSITHGVKGTPMPPWGEVAEHKPYLKNIPILNETEIKQLADWLFSSLQGGEEFKSSKDVQKWQYSPEDIIKELLKEGNQLKGQKINDKKAAAVLDLPKGEGLLASLTPSVPPKKEELKEPSYEELVFDKKNNSVSVLDPWSYYIKKEYYTPENIQAGRHFFEQNCAVCHGTEADGMGVRAEFMKDAKPRMLTNLDWLNTHDDLRLIRSIKYGVPGTAMTPWGDFTSSLQRLQLVIFIRSLSEKHLRQDRLTSTLYQAFNPSLVAIGEVRGLDYQVLDKAKSKYQKLVLEREKQYNHFQTDEEKSKRLLETYQKELEALSQLKKIQEKDELVNSLAVSLNQEKDIYQQLGNLWLNNLNNDVQLEVFLQLISINHSRYMSEKNELTADFNEGEEQKRHKLVKELINYLDVLIHELENKKKILEGKIASVENDNEIKEISVEINNFNNLKNAFLSKLAEATRLRKEQQALYQKYIENTH